MVKKVLKPIFIFIATALSLIIILTLVNLIPQASIKEKTELSTAYLQANPGFPVLIDNFENTRLDNYADSMTINVTYNVNSERPFYSLVADKYYRIEGNDSSEDLARSVFQGEKPQNDYSRYWHGIQILLRPLLTVCQLYTARIVIACIVLFLNVLLCIVLWKKNYKMIMLVYIVCAISVDMWMCAFSLEYVDVFLVLSAILLAVAFTEGRDMDTIIIISGVATCFFDFLTTETLTFTVPVLMYLFIKNRKNESIRMASEMKRLLILGFEWLFAYAGMFLVKWGLVYIVCGKESFLTALSSAALRINGVVADDLLTPAARIFLTLLRNIGCMTHVVGSAAVSEVLLRCGIIIFIIAAILYVFYKKNHNRELAAIMLLIGLIPYARYIILSNHSYLHYFFTYRAQMATVLAVLCALCMATDFRQFSKKTNNKKTNNKKSRK